MNADAATIPPTRRATLRVPAGVRLPGEPEMSLALDVHWPPSLPQRPLVWVCLPGGAMNRHYFDLIPPRERGGGDLILPRADGGDAAAQTPEAQDGSYSFARQMTARGFLVVALDPLGVGDSHRPADGYALTPEVVSRANAAATERVLAALRAGHLDAGLPPLPGLVALGLGHSMGAMLTVLQQAEFRTYRGIALLGFSTRGLPEYLPPAARALADDPAVLRARLPELARAQFVDPYPVLRPSPRDSAIYGGETAEAAGILALKRARDRLLPVPAFASMLPGNVAAEAARIDVPVFLGLGERDMAGPPHEIPAAFPASQEVSLCVLPEAGHAHFLFASRTRLFARLAQWANTMVLD